MRLTFVCTIAALVALVSVGATYPAAAKGERHACSVACGGGIPGKTCGDYKVSQQRCFNQCMGYEACSGVGVPTAKKNK
jgi:hypothetical protein